MSDSQPRKAATRFMTALAVVTALSVGIANAAMPVPASRVTAADHHAVAHSARKSPGRLDSADASGAATSIATLAKRITGKKLNVAVSAVQEVLARSGVATREGKHTYRKAVAPPASSTATRYETINLALDAQDQAYGGATTLADLGHTLLKLHAFKKHGRSPGVAMRDFMTAWVRTARRIPKHSQSFAPLFLAQLAKRQKPAINLAAGKYKPATLRLSLLELEIISAAFDRFPAKARHPLKVKHHSRAAVGIPQQAVAAAAGPGNCADVLKEYIGKVVPGYDQIESSAIQSISQEAISIAIAKLMTGKKVEDAAAVFKSNQAAWGGILSLVNTLMRLAKLAALYKGVQLEVEVLTTPIEKPEAQQNYAAGQSQYGDGQFAAVVGLSPNAEKQYQKEINGLGDSFRAVRKAIQDCASVVGLPAPAYSDDIAEDLTLFKVKWTLKASSHTANYEFKKTVWFAPGARLGSLTRLTDTQAAHVMHVNIPTQPQWSYAPHRFHKVSTYADATAELITAQPPTLGTLINGILGPLAPFGLVDALVELSVGWFQSLATPEDTGQMDVTEHKPICIVDTTANIAQTWQLPGSAAADQCDGRYGGTFSGTADLSTGLTPLALKAAFSGTVVLKPVPSSLPPGFPITNIFYTIESGSMDFRISGTLSDGCVLHAEGPVDLLADPGSTSVVAMDEFLGKPDQYSLIITPPLTADVPGTLTDCTDPGDDKTTTWPVSGGVAALIYSQQPEAPVGSHGQVAGTNSGRVQVSDPTQTWAWKLIPL